MDPSAPADTRAMAVVHNALRRDLERARRALTASPPPRVQQEQAIGRHVLWLMAFLHQHHTGEDTGLWPLVLRHDPAAAPLLASLEAEHACIAPFIAELTAAAQAYVEAASDRSRSALVTALGGLAEVLVPHLDREVAEAMPVVSAAITQADWHEFDQTYNIKGKSSLQLALEGHFLIDGADTEGRDVILHLVPPVQRFVLLRGFGWLYRRQARRRWGALTPARAGAARP